MFFLCCFYEWWVLLLLAAFQPSATQHALTVSPIFALVPWADTHISHQKISGTQNPSPSCMMTFMPEPWWSQKRVGRIFQRAVEWFIQSHLNSTAKTTNNHQEPQYSTRRLTSTLSWHNYPATFGVFECFRPPKSQYINKHYKYNRSSHHFPCLGLMTNQRPAGPVRSCIPLKDPVPVLSTWERGCYKPILQNPSWLYFESE